MQKKLLHIAIWVVGCLTYAQQCPSITLPANGATDIATDTPISWTAIEGALGYFLLVGTTPGGRDLVDRVDVGNTTTYEPPNGLPGNTVIYVKVTVYFADGFDNTCPVDEFTTGEPSSGTGDCDHFITPVPDFYACDEDLDSFEEFDIDLEELETQLLGNQTGLTISYFNAGGDPIDFTDPGEHIAVNQRTIRVRAVNADGCYKETSFDLKLVTPPMADIQNNVVACQSFVLPPLDADNHYFTASGGNGTQLQEGGLITETRTIYIYIEKSGCSDQSSFEVTIDPTDCEPPATFNTNLFPAFFTPNGDGINDFWKYLRPKDANGPIFRSVQIFDRFGTLLSQVTPDSQGWNGMFKGKRLPSSDYWFKAVTDDNIEIRGHFTLKR